MKMKKTVILSILLFLFLIGSAQQSDLIIHSPENIFGVNDEELLDFDMDGESDLCISLNDFNNQFTLDFNLTNLFFDQTLGYYHRKPWYVKTLLLNDTIPNATGFGSFITQHFDVGEMFFADSLYAGIQHPVADGYCYGWVLYSLRVNVANHSGELILHKYAYCSIPNYPLIIGQISLNSDVRETEIYDRMKVYPNPATRLLFVEGENLKLATIYNILGQKVFFAKAHDGNITLDLNGQPAGIYFVTITDQEGRKCVKKVVKQ